MKIGDKVWQSYLQYQLHAKPQAQGMKNGLKAWAYLLLRGSLLICFDHEEQSELPSYPMFIKVLKEQANTWGWPQHAYSTKPLLDDFVLTLPKLPGITIYRPLAYTHNEDQFTPLLCALENKQWKVAEWLIEKSACIDVSDSQGHDCVQLVFNFLKEQKRNLGKEDLKEPFPTAIVSLQPLTPTSHSAIAKRLVFINKPLLSLVYNHPPQPVTRQ